MFNAPTLKKFGNIFYALPFVLTSLHFNINRQILWLSISYYKEYIMCIVKHFGSTPVVFKHDLKIKVGLSNIEKS